MAHRRGAASTVRCMGAARGWARRTTRLVSFVCTSAALAACGSNPTPANAPLSAINDPKAHTSTRLAAIQGTMERVAAGDADRLAMRESLKRVIWARSTWGRLRLAAITELVEDQQGLDDTRTMMRLLLPTEKDPQVIAFVGTTAGERGWQDLAPALVRSWSRPNAVVPDRERSECAAIVALFPERPVQDTVFEVFTGRLSDPGKAMETSARQDAWSLLQRLDRDGARVVALLAQDPGTGEDALTRTLRRAARDFAVIPDTGEELAWLERLGGSQHADLWSESARAVSLLGPEQRNGLRTRHVLGARWAAAQRPQWLAATQEQLLSELEAALSPRRQHLRGVSGTRGGFRGESVAAARERMVWGDALLALIAATAVEDPGLAKAVIAHAQDDARDTSTELGGVIDASGPSFTTRRFPPRASQRAGDQRFIASPEMIDQGADSLFHYHMHVNEPDNGQYAGPSDEDVQYAARHGRACLVFTSIQRGTLNADYYQPGGVVIDLGEIKGSR